MPTLVLSARRRGPRRATSGITLKCERRGHDSRWIRDRHRLGSTTGSALYRARRALTQAPALLKLPLSPDTAPSQLPAMRREYDLLRSLPLPGIARPVDLIEDRESGSLTVVLAPFDGESLEVALRSAPLSWLEALRTMRALAQMLVGLHAARVVHKDLR